MDDRKPVVPDKANKLKDRVFMSAAYIMEIEPKTYGLYRNIEMETDRVGPDGKKIREKVKAIGPIRLLREAEPGEEQLVVLRTVHPETFKELSLVEIT